jgi:hypothetical protein
LSATAIAGPAGAVRWAMGRKIADWTIAVVVFLGGFVIVEPSPYDIILVAVIAVWAFFGLRINRHFLPMTVLMLLYVAGGWLSFTQLDTFARPLLYMATTTFLVASSIFYAAVIVEDPERRLAIIAKAYIVSAVIVALIGILAYFNVLPYSDYFKLYDRAKGTFQDPNVFGPFLVLPAALLVRRILTMRLSRTLPAMVWLLIILFAIFLSFSRAAWGLAVFTLLVTAYLAFVTEWRHIVRLRLVAYLAAGIVVVATMVAVALTIPSVSNLFVQRAQIVQTYDEGQSGRFERQVFGFFLAQQKPLGIGPYEFGKLAGEDQHNMWLKGFTVYGWLGGFSYIILVVWTLVAATPLLFKPRPWQPMLQCVYAVYLGHLLIHNVIDNDHWRHLYLLYGILWGTIAAEKMLKREWLRSMVRVSGLKGSAA